jgi:hypothetical protein
MTERSKIQEAVFRAIDRTRELSMDESGLVSSDEVVLLGDGAVLDSMNFVNFAVGLEDELNKFAEKSLNVVELLNSSEQSTSTTAGQLVDILHQSLQ